MYPGVGPTSTVVATVGWGMLLATGAGPSTMSGLPLTGPIPPPEPPSVPRKAMSVITAASTAAAATAASAMIVRRLRPEAVPPARDDVDGADAGSGGGPATSLVAADRWSGAAGRF